MKGPAKCPAQVRSGVSSYLLFHCHYLVSCNSLTLFIIKVVTCSTPGNGVEATKDDVIVLLSYRYHVVNYICSPNTMLLHGSLSLHCEANGQ